MSTASKIMFFKTILKIKFVFSSLPPRGVLNLKGALSHSRGQAILLVTSTIDLPRNTCKLILSTINQNLHVTMALGATTLVTGV